MSERSGFFNAIETGEGIYDKTYDAEDFAQYFATFIGNGVFINPSNQLKVIPKTGLTVTVKAGKAFIDGYWYELDEDMDITLTANGTSNTINDVIVCTLNKSNRTITTVKKESVSSTLPVNNGTMHELILAVVSVGVGVSSLTASNITDTRPDNTYCGYVGALIEQVDFGNLFDQMESQFNVWFDEMKGQLTTDAAGNLQTQINGLKEQVENVVTQINGNTGILEVTKTYDGGVSETDFFEYPEGFDSDNSYIKSFSMKRISGGNSNTSYFSGINDWYYPGASYTQNVSLMCITNKDFKLSSESVAPRDVIRFHIDSYSNRTPQYGRKLEGTYTIRVVLEKIVKD